MPPWGGHLQLLYMYILVLHMCVWMWACAWMWGHVEGTPRHTHTHSHPPTHRQEPGWLKSLNMQLKLERIKIIQFRLKIWDLCTFLHLFRLGVVCRWGVVPSQIAFFIFGPKTVHVFCSCEPLGKIFLFSHWNVIYHVQTDNQYDFWPPDPIMTLSNCSWNEDKSAKFDFDINFIIEPSIIEKFVMYHLIA